MVRRFTLDEPESIKDVSFLLSKYGDKGAILAGGTELLLLMKQGVVPYEHLINIKQMPGLDKISYDEKGGQLKIGPLVTHRALEKADVIQKRFPLMAEMERKIGKIRLRNVGTVAGNLCIADPHSDVETLLLALGARVKAVGLDGERVIPLEGFFIDYYETVLKKDEVLIEIQVPSLPPHSSGAYLRFAIAERPTVGVAVILTFEPQNEGIREAIITLGCVNPTPIRAREAEELIKGKAAGEVLANLERVGEIAAKESSPADDIHASEWYKREMVKVMVQRGIREAYQKRVELKG